MEKWKRNAVRLLCGLALEEKNNPSVIETVPQKTSVSAPAGEDFPKRTPDAAGVASGVLADMLSAMEADRRVMLHCLYVVKDGREILSVAHPGYDVHIRYLSHSMAKSVTGIVIGMLTDDGTLRTDDRVLSFFPDIVVKDKRVADMTVEDLLIMASGVPYAEAGSVTDEKWTEAFFSSPLRFAPGSNYAYNSMNSYILARIAEVASGEDFVSLVGRRLFAPLGITDFLWERSPEGTAKGGFGLYLSAVSWAKIGQMMAEGGLWKGKRLLSQAWISRSVTTHSITPSSTGDFNYGYHLWVAREGSEFLFNGMLGQNVWICPDRHIVAVLLSGNNEIFQQSPALNILRTYLGEDVMPSLSGRAGRRALKAKKKNFFAGRHWIRPLPEKKTLAARLGLVSKTPYDSAWDELLGVYEFPVNMAAPLPVFVRMMQNNFTGGIRRLTVTKEGERIVLRLLLGDDDTEIYLPVGLYGYRTCTATFGGEPYLVRAFGEAAEDEDRNRVFKIEFIFPELPNVRKIKLSFTSEGHLLLRMSEVPDRRIVDSYLAAFTSEEGKYAFFLDLLKKKAGEDFLGRAVAAVFSPSVSGVRTDAEDKAAFFARCERERTARLSAAGHIVRMITRFVGADDERTEDARRGLFSLFGFGRRKGRDGDDLPPADRAEDIPPDGIVLPSGDTEPADLQEENPSENG